LARGDRFWVGPLLVRALHPPPPDAWASDANNGSLVLRVEWGLAAVVLTGDAERPAETEIMAAHLPLDATILKVGHHGSRYASSAPFLAAVTPRLALVSVGIRNPFGHPSPEALARLADAGAAVYRTDYDGAVEITSDGAELRVRRWTDPGTVQALPLEGAP
jgi:beta-lactamase superfamily II metal-dependent hydrolase